MERAGELAKLAAAGERSLPQQSRPPQTRPASLGRMEGIKADRVIARIWSSMAQTFGHRWSSSFGSALKPKSTELTPTAAKWKSALSAFEVEEIGYALKAMETKPSDYWPTLNGFIECCRAGRGINEAMRSAIPALPETKERREQRKKKAAAELRNIKQKLKGA